MTLPSLLSSDLGLISFQKLWGFLALGWTPHGVPCLIPLIQQMESSMCSRPRSSNFVPIQGLPTLVTVTLSP